MHLMQLTWLCWKLRTRLRSRDDSNFRHVVKHSSWRLFWHLQVRWSTLCCWFRQRCERLGEKMTTLSDLTRNLCHQCGHPLVVLVPLFVVIFVIIPRVVLLWGLFVVEDRHSCHNLGCSRFWSIWVTIRCKRLSWWKPLRNLIQNSCFRGLSNAYQAWRNIFEG